MLDTKKLLVAACFLWSFSAPAAAQSPAQWDAMRVYFESQYLEKVVTDAYSPITIQQLEKELAAIENRRRVSPQLQRGVVRATYIVALRDGRLVSPQSEWQMRGAWQELPADYADLGNISFSPTRARSQDDGQRQLVDIDRYLPTGELVVPDDPAYPEIVFGFTLPEVRPGSKQFDVRVPAASIAQMYISVPAGMEVTSSQATCEQVDAQSVPLDADAAEYAAVGDPIEWWLLTCSGLEQFEIKIEQGVAVGKGLPQILISKGAVEYQVDASDVRVTAAFQLADSASDSPVRLSLASGVKLLGVDVDGVAIDWHALLTSKRVRSGATEPAGSDDGMRAGAPRQTLVNLDTTVRQCAGKTITVRAVFSQSADQQLSLSAFQVDGAYCFSGTTKVSAERGILLSALSADGVPVAAKAGDDSKQRIVDWMGQPPALVADLLFASGDRVVESLTRFAIQPTRFSATCRTRVNVTGAKTNLLTFSIERNWLVDSVRIVGEAESRIRTSLRQAKGTQRWFVDVTWDDNPVDLQFDLEIAAHDPRNRRSERFSLWPRSLLTLPETQQSDVFVIEPSGQFRVDVTRSLLATQVQPVDLPAWQRELLGSDSSEEWVFAQRRGNVPVIKFQAYRGSFVANIVSMVKGDSKAKNDLGEKWSVISNIECRPISGAITAVSCVLPVSVEPESVTWSLLDSEGELDAGQLTIGPVASTTSEARLIAIDLPAPTSQPFTLQARIEASVAATQIELPVVAVPGAVGGSSIVLLPPDLLLSPSSTGVQVLPDANGFAEPRYDERLGNRTAKQRSEFVAVRVDAAASHLLPATVVRPTEPNAVWIQDQVVTHRALAGQELQHIVRWTVKSGAGRKLKVRLPDQWQLRSLRINGKMQENSATESERLTIDLPVEPTNEIEAEFASAVVGGNWMQRIDLQQPESDAPTISARCLVSIPPSKTTYSMWSMVGRGETLMDRVVPRRLWQILAPSGSDESVAGWTTIELSPDKRASGANDSVEELVLFSRTALAAFATAFVLICVGLLRLLMPHSLAYWITVLLSGMATVLLVPVAALPVVQLALLSVCVAFTFRLMQPVFQYRASAEAVASGPRSWSMRSMFGVVLVMLISIPSARGQLLEQGAVEGAGVKTYGLLIPTTETEDGVEVDGSYAYIPKELLELLRRDDEGAPNDIQPHILAADYHLRLRKNTLTGVTRATDFRLDLKAAFPRVTSELSLAFTDASVVLTGAQINGQSVAPGGRVVQDADGIVLRPGTMGEIDIQLQFAELTPEEADGRSTILVAIPPLPVASLRIVTDSQQEFEIESIGPIQRSMASTLARIGQLDKLHVSWNAGGTIVDAVPDTLQLESQTWLHAAAEKLVAASRLSLVGTLPASGEISVVIDAGWAPVGDQWGDAAVLDSSLVAYGRQVSYRLRCSPKSEDPNRCDISLLLVPRNPDRAATMRAPFLSLQGSSQPQRVFFWSADRQSSWRPEDLAFWQPSDPADFASWGVFAFADADPVAFTATAEASTPTARRQPASKLSTVLAQEETLLHLGESESRLDYTAQFDVPWEQGQFHLKIPDGCRVSGVQIDKADVGTYVVGEHPTGRELIVESPATSVTSVTVQVVMRTRLGVATKMPRLHLSGIAVSSSRYYIFRGAGLECDLETIPELPFAPFSVPASQLLQQLESAVAAVDLEGEFRDIVQLPAAYRVERTQRKSQLQTLQKIVRTEQGWQETLYCVWDGVESPLDIVCLEIPAKLRDEIDLGPLSRRYVPTGDPDTLTLCVLPPPPENSRVMIAMRFPVPTASSNQTLGLEKIKVLDHDEVVSFIALPSEFMVPGSAQPQPVRWTKVGREVSASGFGSMLGQGPWKVYRTLGRQTQASWLARGVAKSGRILRQLVEVTGLDASGATVLASYWIDPAGQTNFSATIADGCELLGVRSGGRVLDWHFQSDQQRPNNTARILLRPNYLPTYLSLLLKYKSVNPDSPAVELPAVSMDGGDQRIDVINKLSGYVIVGARPSNTAGQPQSSSQVQQWADVLADALPTLSDLSDDEVTQWLRSWHPSRIGVPPNAMVQVPEVLWTDSASSREASAADYWRAVGEQLGSSLPGEVASLLEATELNDREIVSSQRVELGAGNTLSIRKQVAQTNRSTRLGAALALLLILVLVLLLRQRIGSSYAAVVAQNPWLYWLQLSAVLLVMLPVVWPAAMMCILATISAVSQWVDQWKRRRAGIQPR
ncbi:MAG: hypothetical protein Aurels2KO_49160 [Aureliella sp.]